MRAHRIAVELVAIGLLAVTSASAQTTSRTPWGDPDLQGAWDFTTITALERPAQFAGKEFLNEREAAALEKQINDQRYKTEETSPGSLGGVPRAETDPGIYNLAWWWGPNGRTLVRSRRSSLVVDPKDGKIPALTSQAQAISRARDEARERRRGPSDLPLAERCIMGFNSGPPMVPGPYNNLVQIFQSPGYVVIVNEMVHDARVVPLDSRPHVGGSIRLWAGDSRGRWDGTTLVVETRNFTDSGTGISPAVLPKIQSINIPMRNPNRIMVAMRFRIVRMSHPRKRPS